VTEPPRLHTEPESELERSLLDAGRSYTASASSRAKALAALGVVGITASSTTAASAVTKASLTKWLTATALVAGAAIPGVHYLRQLAAKPAPPDTSVVSAGPSVASIPPLQPASAPSAATPDSAPVQPANSAPDPVVTSAPPTVARAESKPATPALAAELSALDTARSALASGNATAALSDLDAYARNFPHGRLGLEAEVLRIDALAKSGQTVAARKRAEAFMKRHPDSVLASRVRAYAGQ
jgi:hypothetical protein